MKKFLLKSFEIFCKLWLAFAYSVATIILGIIGFVSWLLSPTQPEEDPKDGAQELENWFGSILLFLIIIGAFFWLNLIN